MTTLKHRGPNDEDLGSGTASVATEVADKRRVDAEGHRTTAAEAEPEWVIEPLQEWVLIRKLEREEKVTEAGVVLPGGGKSSRGIVIAAAEKVPLEKGDIVIFTNFPIELEDLEELTGDKALKLVRYEEVYARFRKRICT